MLFQAARNLTEVSLKEVSIHELKSPYLNSKAASQPDKMKKPSEVSNLVTKALNECVKEKNVFSGKLSGLFEKRGDKLTSSLAKSLADSISFSANSSNICKYSLEYNLATSHLNL